MSDGFGEIQKKLEIVRIQIGCMNISYELSQV